MALGYGLGGYGLGGYGVGALPITNVIADPATATPKITLGTPFTTPKILLGTPEVDYAK